MRYFVNNLDRYLFAGLLSAYVIKVGFTGASLADALILLVLAAIHGVLAFGAHNKKIAELKQQLAESEKSNNEKISAIADKLEETRSALAGVKISQGFRPVK